MRVKEEPLIISFARRRLGFSKVRCCGSGTDRRLHYSGVFIRAILVSSRRCAAFMAVPEGLALSLAERFLAEAVIWWDGTSGAGKAEEMILFVPAGWRQKILGLLPFLKIPLQCFAYESSPLNCREIFPGGARLPDLSSPYIIYPGTTPSGMLAEMKQRFPGLDLIFRRDRWELSCLGLPVLWMDKRGACWFDFRNPRKAETFPGECTGHIREVLAVRSGGARGGNSFNYVFGPERWLESMLIKDLSLLRPGLGSRFYCQVPSRMDGENRILDILAVDDQGTLVVLEVKAECRTEDIFQGLVYRDRVACHQKEGDFQEKGYFRDITISGKSPVLGFISPLFAFHRTLPVIWKYLNPGGEVFFVGINSNWRDGIMPLRRFNPRTEGKENGYFPYS